MKRLIAVIAAVAALACVGGFGGTPATAAKRGPVVLMRTVPVDGKNSFFDVTSMWHPQVAQSLIVTKPMRWTALRLGTYQLKRVTSKDVYQWLLDGGYDENWFISNRIGVKVSATVTVEVWRKDDDQPIGDTIDLASGFTQVHRSEGKRTIPIGVPVTFPIPKGLAVTPGRYFLVLGFRFDDPLVFNLRFDGQENGTNTLGGYNHDKPIRPECAKYTMTKDTYPEGRAYRPVPGPDSKPDPETFIMPFTTVFEVYETKVMLPCDMNGVYGDENQIWNPGDLDLVVLGRR